MNGFSTFEHLEAVPKMTTHIYTKNNSIWNLDGVQHC
jgi:hypothetical protein